MKPRHLLLFAILLITVLSAVRFWWYRHPLLIVHVGPEMARYLDRDAYVRAFRNAGVRRIRLEESAPGSPLGATDGEVRIAIELSEERNPKVDEEMRARGLTGPGYTDRYTGIAYHPDIRLFILKHRKTFREAGILDWSEVEIRLITNTAVHESWHAITQSTSHNATDRSSVMYLNPSGSPLGYGWERLQFTAGHKSRLQEMFSARPL